MKKTSNQCCTLCHSQTEQIHLTGQRIFQKKIFPYALCKKCCLKNYEYSDNGVNRKKLWSLIDKEISKKSVEA